MSDDSDTTIQSRTARPPDRTEVFGPAQTEVYDVWEPAADRGRGVTVALVHGGFWREEYDRAHLAPLAEALARDGFHVANLEYARTGMPGGGWPGTGESVLGALDAVHADTKLPDRVVVVGHSAGGHLALWLASGDRAPWVTGVVALAPVADLAEADRLHLSEDAARALLGGTREDHPQAWADADPGGQRLTVPTVVVTGELDDVVPGSVTRAYLASRSADEPVHSTEAKQADHDDVIDPLGSVYLLVLAEVEELTLTTH